MEVQKINSRFSRNSIYGDTPLRLIYTSSARDAPTRIYTSTVQQTPAQKKLHINLSCGRVTPSRHVHCRIAYLIALSN